MSIFFINVLVSELYALATVTMLTVYLSLVSDCIILCCVYDWLVACLLSDAAVPIPLLSMLAWAGIVLLLIPGVDQVFKCLVKIIL